MLQMKFSRLQSPAHVWELTHAHIPSIDSSTTWKRLVSYTNYLPLHINIGIRNLL